MSSTLRCGFSFQLTNGAGWKGNGLADALKPGQEIDGVVFSPFGEEEGEFDIIIHKLDGYGRDERTRAIMKNAKFYLERFPETLLVDPLESVLRLGNRADICAGVSRARLSQSVASGYIVSQPRYTVFRKTLVKQESESQSPNMVTVGHNDVVSAVESAGLSYPVIVKPIDACGSPESHSIVVATTASDLANSALVSPGTPCLVQEYLDHGGIYFKVYFVGGEVRIHSRRSLPDLQNSKSEMTKDHDLHSLRFDSRREYPSIRDFTLTWSGSTRLQEESGLSLAQVGCDLAPPSSSPSPSSQ